MLVAPVLAVAAPRRNEHALQPMEHALQPKDTTAELAQQLLVRHAVKAELARLSDDELAAMVPRTAIVMSPEGTRFFPAGPPRRRRSALVLGGSISAGAKLPTANSSYVAQLFGRIDAAFGANVSARGGRGMVAAGGDVEADADGGDGG